jgi:hypothetical protein
MTSPVALFKLALDRETVRVARTPWHRHHLTGNKNSQSESYAEIRTDSLPVGIANVVREFERAGDPPQLGFAIGFVVYKRTNQLLNFSTKQTKITVGTPPDPIRAVPATTSCLYSVTLMSHFVRSITKPNTLCPFAYTEVQVRCANAQWNMTMRRS